MNTSVSIDINKSKKDVWQTITNIENSPSFINSIISLEVLEKPENTLLDFKWKETREMFGKEVTETMWITDVANNEFYQTRAESHGSIYISRLAIETIGEKTKLTMSFTSEAVSFFAKIMSTLMGPMIKKSMVKAMNKDLEDIKAYLESN